MFLYGVNMKQEQIYLELKLIAEKLGLIVAEKSFRNLGIIVRSGFCRVKNENKFIMDKHKPLPQKIAILAAELNRYDLENIYIVPVIREILEEHAETGLNDLPED